MHTGVGGVARAWRGRGHGRAGRRWWGRKPRVGLGKGVDGGEEFGVRLPALKAGGEDLGQGWQLQRVGEEAARGDRQGHGEVWTPSLCT
jgi:hypothetical protein